MSSDRTQRVHDLIAGYFDDHPHEQAVTTSDEPEDAEGVYTVVVRTPSYHYALSMGTIVASRLVQDGHALRSVSAAGDPSGPVSLTFRVHTADVRSL